MKTYYIDAWEQAVRFRTIEVKANDEKEALEIANTLEVNFEGAEWNTEEIGFEDVWEEV